MVVYTPEQRWEVGLTEDADFSKKKIIFSDAAHFDLGGIWGTENPHAYIEKPTLKEIFAKI